MEVHRDGVTCQKSLRISAAELRLNPILKGFKTEVRVHVHVHVRESEQECVTLIHIIKHQVVHNLV